MFSRRAVKNVSSSCKERLPSPGGSISGTGSGAGISVCGSAAIGDGVASAAGDTSGWNVDGAGDTSGWNVGDVGDISGWNIDGAGGVSIAGILGTVSSWRAAGGRAMRFRS